ncbi:MAG: O-antigen ligase family protein [Pseudomonadota bacterium]
MSLIERDIFTNDRVLSISATNRDYMVIMMWFCVTYRQFPMDELLLYPLALYFAYAFVRDLGRNQVIIRQSFVLWLFPIWWMLSIMWAVAPGVVLKSGMQILLSMMICYGIVTRLGPRHAMIAMFVAASITGVYSAFLGEFVTRPDFGAYSSKNASGTAASLMWVCSLCVLIDKGSPPLARLAALAMTPLAAYLIMASNSATAVLMMLATGGIAVGGSLVLCRKGYTLLERGLLFLFASICMGAAAMLIARLNIDPFTALLDAFGKDTTLTGRTILWEYAMREIEERPLLGVGQGGFWRPYADSPTVRLIFSQFGKGEGAVFNFHNSYFEVAVHQGLIGLGITVVAVLWTLTWLVRGTLRDSNVPKLFFLCIAFIVFLRSFTESGLMSPFSKLPMLFWCGALFMLKESILRERAWERARR